MAVRTEGQRRNRILDEFEEFLAAKGIMVPSDDREGREEEACLYGREYYELEDAIAGALMEEFGGQAREAPGRGPVAARSWVI